MTGKRVFWYFTAFFGFIAIVNAVMMTLAIHTHSGLVTDHAYEKGLAYNDVVKAEAAQENLGWKGEINYTKDVLHFVLKDKSGVEIQPETSRATFTRPAEQGMDFTVELTGEQTAVNFPAKGVWDVRVDATVGGQTFQHTQRMIVE